MMMKMTWINDDDVNNLVLSPDFVYALIGH
jgi:hypothetical protein